MIWPCKVAVSLLAAAMAWGDIRTRRIPNALVLALFCTGLVNALAVGMWPGVVEAVGVFAVGFLLFQAGMLGGGDVKAITAGAFLLPGQLATLCLLTALAGGAQACLALLRGLARKRLPRDIPYGVAIAAGIVACVWL